MPQPDKRSALHVLTKARLRELVDAFELKLAAAESKDAHVELLARSKKATLPKLLELLQRDELKDICRAHGLADGGREKAPIIARLLGQPTPSDDPSPPEDDAPPAPPTRSPREPATPLAPWRDTGPLEPGQIVHVRARQYLVNEVVPPPQPGHATLLRLSCLEDDAQGDPLEVLWEHELDARVLGRASWDRVASRGFDRPALFSAYLHTLRWACVTATDPKLFQSPYRAGIEVKDYQLEPLRKALAMPRVRLFIADDVGLGKTIEAGLILREMLLRQRVRQVVVACPPSVVRQWQEEMEQRFGLTFVIFDRDFVAACRRERGYGVNPWTTHTRFIISHPLLRDETYAAPLREWLRPETSEDQTTAQSLLILDEAHNAAPASGARYAVDSHFTRAIRELAQRFEHRLFLSATPHNGHSNSFSALLEILDPDRFCRGVPPDGHLLDEVLVRRLKSDLREISTDDFPDRRVVPEVLDNLPEDAPELLLSRLLQRYRELREARLAAAPRGQRSAGMLVVTALQKRLLSSIEAFASTLAVHRRAIDKHPTHSTDDTLLPDLSQGPGADDERAELPEEELAREDAAQLELATTRGPALGPEERALLTEMAKVAEAARHLPDARVRRFFEWLRLHACPDLGSPDARWNDRRVLLFTEYADTKRYLMDQIGAAIESSDQANLRIRAFHGGMGDDAREQIKHAFNADPKQHPLRILVATDAAREGVNLQNHCADLFHFDIPWNPSRMEQRNGRIDRKLQRSPVVHCRYFVLPQRAEDRVLDVLVRKTATIHRELGSLSPVVERNLEELLRGGIAHTREADLTAEISAQEARPKTLLDLQITSELEQVRKRQHDLKLRVQELRGLLKASRDWLGLTDEHFRGALSAALELLGAEPLIALDATAQQDPARARWRVPALDRRAGADPTWAATLDTLRVPRRRDQKPWEWRREAPIRPVVFRDPRSLDGEVVHLHLEHRVVQRLLGRFRSQGFLHDELTRACVLRSDNPEPKLLVLGRLSLYGPRAARLHDEVLAVAAEWIDPDLRARKKLTALPRGERDEILAQLETSLATPRLRDVPEALQTRLRSHAARDVAELLPQLETRARERIAAAEKLLRRRGEQEAAALAQVIAGQVTRIQRKIREHDDTQLGLDFRDEQERRQIAADRRYWDLRLPELAREAERAPAAIQRGYVVQAVRVEPVGLVYLWPVSA